MTAVQARDVDGALRRMDPRIVVELVYGPDAGLVNERARAAAAASVADPADPFQLIRMDGDGVAADPGSLADEAGTMGLFGARRAIWVKPTSRNIAGAVEAVLKMDVRDTRIVIEAGDLAKTSPLRVACERSPLALALPCYADTPQDLGATITETLRAGGFTIGAEARQILAASLGGDRLATRGELAKLMLYAHGAREITLDDVDAVISDVSSLATDAVVDAAFSGDVPGLEAALRRLLAEGSNPSVILGAALRHALTLLAHRVEVENGKPVGAAIEAWRGLHFKRKAAATRQLGRWRVATLLRAVETLQTGVLEARRVADLGDTLASQILFDLAGRGGEAPSGR